MLFNGYAEEKVIYEGRHVLFILVIEMQSVVTINTSGYCYSLFWKLLFTILSNHQHMHTFSFDTIKL